MAKTKKDPTEPIRLQASRYPEVDEGTACTQSSFKTRKKAFLFVGMQGGRYKAMFKLEKSKPEAASLAEKEPDRFDVGSTAWVTARFTAEKPMPKRLWQKWLDESYALSAGPSPAKKAKAAAKKKTTKKKTAKKKAASGKSAAKKVTKKKATAKKAAKKKATKKKTGAHKKTGSR